MNETEIKSADSEEVSDKLTSSKLAQKLGIKTNELIDKLVATGFLEARDVLRILSHLVSLPRQRLGLPLTAPSSWQPGERWETLKRGKI